MPYDSSFGQMMTNVFGNFDMTVFSVFGHVQNDLFTFLAKFFTCLGEPIFIIMFGVVAIVMCFFKRTRKVALLILFAMLFFLVINHIVLKSAFMRIRPYNALQGNSEFFSWYMNVGAIAETPYCFPSGHSCATCAICLAVFLWLKLDLKKPEGCLLLILPVLIGFSRIYFMLHYPTDVIAGWIEGIIFGFASWYIVKFVYFISDKLPKPLKIIWDIDLQPWAEKKFGHKLKAGNVTLFIVLLLFCFSVTTFTKNEADFANPDRCQHQGPDYICMNKADTQFFNEQTQQWEYYCKIHK